MSTLGETLRQRVTADCAARGLLPRAAPLLIGLSGGRDSVALLALLADLRPWGQWSLLALHCNHNLRGPDAARADRDLCRDLCNRLNVPLICEDLVLDLSPPGVGVEEAARNARMSAFRRRAIHEKCPIVVTAHHADDRVETVLFRILRGTGLRGLPGIYWRREEPLLDPPHGLGFSVLQFQRPLLGVWREELTEYARAAGLRWNDDPTNDSDAHDRNRIRRSLLPKLAVDFNPEVRRHVWDLAEDAADWLAIAPAPAASDTAPALSLTELAALADPADGDEIAAAPPDDLTAPPTGDATPDVPVNSAAANLAGDLWPWPELPLVLDGATLLGLGRSRALQALQALLEIARRRTGHPGSLSRLHYRSLYQMLTDPAAPAQLSLPGGWRARRAGSAPNVRLLIDRS